MGLYIDSIGSVEVQGERSLYLYLLDYGWPEGHWEQLFKKHFMRMADLATDAGAVVVGSSQGVHFSNDVLSWHRVGSLDADKVLPGLLITKTHPAVFQNGEGGEPEMDTLLVIPLRDFCTDDSIFIRSIEQVFVDLKAGLELQNFKIAEQDVRSSKRGLSSRVVEAVELKPGAFGVRLDLKKIFFG